MWLQEGEVHGQLWIQEEQTQLPQWVCLQWYLQKMRRDDCLQGIVKKLGVIAGIVLELFCKDCLGLFAPLVLDCLEQIKSSIQNLHSDFNLLDDNIK